MKNALLELIGVYDDPHAYARAAAARGRPVLGYVGRDFPTELAEAAGFVATRIRGGRTEVPSKVGSALGAEFDTAAHGQLAALWSGEYEYLDQLVVTRDTDSSVRLFVTLRELLRKDSTLRFPDPEFLDLSRVSGPAVHAYNRALLERLRSTLASTGNPTSDDDLRAVIERGVEKRRLLQEVANLRHDVPSRLAGAEALKVIGSSMQMCSQDATRLLRELVASPLTEHHGKRVFVSGSSHDDVSFYEALESRGAVIVGEDHSWGADPAPLVRTGEDPVESLLSTYRNSHPTASSGGITARCEAFVGGVLRSSAQGVVFFIRNGDPSPILDIVSQQRWLTERGIPHIVIANPSPSTRWHDDLTARVDELLAAI